MHSGQRVAVLGIVVSAALAITKIIVGMAGHSTAVVADGCESAGDCFSSGLVLFGLTLAAKPADKEHPYGHGRIETLTGLLIGLALTAAGVLISAASFMHLGQPRAPIETFVIAPLLVSAAAKAGLAAYKFHSGRKLRSSALIADAWHDTTDIVSGLVALAAVGLALSDPVRFADADRYGGILVGIIVVFAGVQVVRETAMQLIDTMPGPERMDEIRAAAATVEGVRGIEKCFARKTGLRYHVDLHLEVDPDMTVRRSHDIAHQVQLRVKERLEWVADVLVHVEPGA
ncbi:MAG TPA: cation diffusion facilitator family transporter [Bryobacteraceae bacterium]|nr:cation diffusion facilitator family transporter [Bryobacteraceae bacterium]